MKMTNEEMGVAVDTLSTLEETGKLGYAIARNHRIIKDCCTEYLNIRNDLFRKYGEQKGNGSMTIREENIPSFLKELGDISQIEHEVNIYTIPEDVFLSGSLTNKQMGSLLWMVNEENGDG